MSKTIHWFHSTRCAHCIVLLATFACATQSMMAGESDELGASLKGKGGTNQNEVLNRSNFEIVIDAIERAEIKIGGLPEAIAEQMQERLNAARFSAIFHLGPDAEGSLAVLLRVGFLNTQGKKFDGDPGPTAHFLASQYVIRDPAMVFHYELLNPFDETLFVVIEGDQETDALGSRPEGSRGDAMFKASLQAIDNNGDGASATSGTFFTITEDDTLLGGPANNILPFGSGFFSSVELSADESTPAVDEGLLEDTEFAIGDPTIGQGMVTTFSISPHDSAIFSGFFSIGDEEMPLHDAALFDDLLEHAEGTHALARELLSGGELLAGDYNNSGQVEQADLDLVLLNWGEPTPPVPDGWKNDLPEGAVDQAELDRVLLNWGNQASATGAAAVPEPTSLSLSALTVLSLLAVRHKDHRNKEQKSRALQFAMNPPE